MIDLGVRVCVCVCDIYACVQNILKNSELGSDFVPMDFLKINSVTINKNSGDSV